MPIRRTFMCESCGHRLELTLTMEQWDDPPPECPMCIQERQMDIDFRPIALGGSTKARAMAYAEKVAAEDYGVADMQLDNRQGGRPKVRYKDAPELKELAKKYGRDARPGAAPSNWHGNQETLLQAVAAGRQARLAGGGKSGLEILQDNIRSGVEPDKIANSKKLSAKIW